MKDLEKGDIVVHEDKEYGYVGYDALNESHVIEDDEGNQFFAEIDPDSLLGETAAADTITAKPTAATPKSAMMAQINSQLAVMNDTDATRFFDQMMAQIGNETPSVKDGQDEENKNSVAMKPSDAMKEDLEQLFGDQKLSEEFKKRTLTLFESAVNARVAILVQEEVERLEEAVAEQINEMEEGMVDKIDAYLNEAVQEWLEENEVAIEASLETELNESFMQGLKKLFEQHYIEIPEDKVDVVGALSEENAELKQYLNETINENIEIGNLLIELNKKEIVDGLTEGMPLSEAEKLRELAETVDFDGDEDEYIGKLNVLKEHYIDKKSPSSKMNLFETVDIEDGDEDETEGPDPLINFYARSISTSKSKK